MAEVEVSSKVMIEVDGLCKSYGSVNAVDNISFKVNAGEILGFLGPNGAGKTTAMKMITGFIAPDDGVSRIGGVDMEKDPLLARARIGYLPENAPLYGEMIVEEYLKFIAEIRKIPKQKINTRLEEVINSCGLRSVLKHRIDELSKGYRQRVGLAQALFHDPDVLILDEPMSGLDPRQIVEIRSLIKRIGETKTVIFSSHILQDIPELCSRIVVIDLGQIVAEGTVEELRKKVAPDDSVIIQVEGDKDKIISAFKELNGVKEITEQNSTENCVSLLLRVERSVDVCKEVFNAVLAGGWILRDLERRDVSLEDVFLALTHRTAATLKREKASV